MPKTVKMILKYTSFALVTLVLIGLGHCPSLKTAKILNKG